MASDGMDEVLGFLAACGTSPREDFFESLARFLAEKLGVDCVCIDHLSADRTQARTLALWCGGLVDAGQLNDLAHPLRSDAAERADGYFPACAARMFPVDAGLGASPTGHCASVLLVDFGGQPVGQIAVIGRRPLQDPALAHAVLKRVAGRAAGELARWRIEADLRTSEEKFRTVADSTYDWELWRDPGHAILYCSPSCERIAGYPAEAFMADSGLLERLILPEDLPKWEAHKTTVHLDPGALPSQAGFEDHLEFRILHREGDVRWIGHVCRPIHDVEGRFHGRRISNRDITARKRAEKALRDSEARFRAIWDAEPECVKLLSPEGVLLDMNLAGLNMLEMDAKEQAIGYPLLGLVVPEHRDRFQAISRRALQEGSGFGEFEIIGKKGTRRWLETHVVPLPDEESRPSLLLAVTRDITPRKRAEAEIVQSEARFRALVENAPEAIVVLDMEKGVFVNVNDKACRLFQLKREQLLTLGPIELSPPFQPDGRPSGEKALELLHRAVAGESPHFEWTHRNALGMDVPCEVYLTRLPSSQGTLVRGSMVDITDRKKAEVALRQSEYFFRESQRAAAIGSYTADLITGAWESSEVLDAIFGIDKAFRRDIQSWLAIVHPDDQPMMSRHLQDEVIGHRRPFSKEYRIIRQNDGAVRWVNGLGAVNFDAPAGSLPMIGTIQDITERKQAELERRQLQAQLQQTQKMESLGSLAGGVAHDMNNVLGAILGLASANLDLHPPDSPTHQTFDTISKAAARGGELVRSLLSFARQSPSEVHDLDLNTLLGEEVRLLKHTTFSRIRLELDLAPDLHHIQGDAAALTHAIMNLCVNAVDAMGDTGTLTLRTRNAGRDRIEILVEDTGCGMTPEVLAKAMDPFFTTKDVGKGTGLGLSLVYSTVKAHLGTVDIQSEPGKGTRVRLQLPTSETEPEAPVSAVEREAVSAVRLRVLLVDDDDLIRSSMGAVLEMLGHALMAVPSGEEALAMLETGFVPDVVILDMNMPGLGGAGTLPRLRSVLPTVPILLATGRADQAAVDLSRAYPHVTLLAKPFNMAMLKKQLGGLTPERAE